MTSDVLVVGAGHSGLAMSALLADAGREHLVVERRDRLGGGWRDRWDEFTLVTPNWTASFPGWAYDGPDPDGFMGRDEIAARVARYAQVVRAPVALGHGGAAADAARRRGLPRQDQPRRRVRPAGRGRDRELSRAAHPADGAAHLRPRRAAALARLPQPGGPAGRRRARRRVGADGLQLAEELFEAGRRVYVSVGSAGRVPRRYRGRDIFSWLIDVIRHGGAYGVALPTAEQLPDGRRRFSAMPALTGRAGGHDTNLRRYAADG